MNDITDHVDTLRADLARLDQRLDQNERAPLEHRVIDMHAYREHRKKLLEHRAELAKELAAAERAEADQYGDDAA